MTSIREDITAQIKTAMKAKDTIRLGTLRMLKAEILKMETASGASDVTDEGLLALLLTMKKQRIDSMTQFRNNGRDDLADKEEAELAVIEGFLPKQLSDDELTAMVAEVGQAIGAADMKAMGNLIKAVREKSAGAADGKRISGAVKAYLSSL